MTPAHADVSRWCNRGLDLVRSWFSGRRSMPVYQLARIHQQAPKVDIVALMKQLAERHRDKHRSDP